MSLSRVFAQLADDMPAFRQAVFTLSKSLISRGRNSSKSFDSFFEREVLHGLHRGGFTREKLRDLKRIARSEYHRAKHGQYFDPNAINDAHIDTVEEAQTT